jgi:hypothetical protein
VLFKTRNCEALLYAGPVRRSFTWRTIVAIGALTLCAGAVAITLVLRDGVVKRRVTRALSDHLNSDVVIGPLSVTLFPSVRIAAEGLTVRRRADPPGQPPLIEATRFTVEPGLWHILRGRAKYVEVEGLRVTIPRRPSSRSAMVDAANAAAAQPTSAAMPASPDRSILDWVVARDAELIYTSSRLDRPARIIHVQIVELRGVSFDSSMQYRAALTNPLPKGRLETTGLFGPFDTADPGRTRIEGSYALSGADFNTVKGLAGTVESRGLFTGQLDQMQVDGITDTADFQLDTGNHAVPLHTEFRATVDGTDGNVNLTHIAGRLRNSPFVANGTIVRVAGVRGRRVSLEVEVSAGRVEDLLTLMLPANRPVMVGDVTMVTSFLLPTGEGRAIDRLEMDGTVRITEANFSDRPTQARVRELSRRAQGKKKGEPSGGALMGLSSRFVYKAGTARFSSLMFRTQGAVVSVAGTYTLASGALNLRGTAKLDASLSRAVGGIRGFFLKVADPLFRKDGAGAVLPISITGPHEAPKVSLDKRRLLK